MLERLAQRLRRLAAAAADVMRGATGADAYDRYLAHQRAHHPRETPLSRAEFFRRETSERWDGVRRCC